MSENWGRRAEDRGKESLLVIMTRVDERLKNHVDKVDEHVRKFDKHVDEDAKNFSFLNKAIWMGIGGLAVFQIVVKFLIK